MKISQENLKKLANVTTKVLHMSYRIIAMLSGIVSIIYLLTFFLSDNTFIPSKYGGNLSITIAGMISYKIDPTIINPKSILQLVLPAFIVFGVSIAIITRQLYLILKTVQDDKPFDEKNPTRLSIIAISLMLTSVLSNIVDFIFTQKVVTMINDPNLTANFKISLGTLLIGILILILAGVFKYGTYLQNEYDATL